MFFQVFGVGVHEPQQTEKAQEKRDKILHKKLRIKISAVCRWAGMADNVRTACSSLGNGTKEFVMVETAQFYGLSCFIFKFEQACARVKHRVFNEIEFHFYKN